MKKLVKDYINKTIKEIDNELRILREEIARLKLESKVNPPKNTNFLIKKKKKLAVLLTILSQKQESEEIVKKTK